MGSVNITLTNGALGATLQTSDGVAGLVVTGTNVSGGLQNGMPVLLTGLASLAEHGVDASNNAFVYKQVQEFYTEAGEGAELYLMMAKPELNVAALSEFTTETGVVKLLNYAQGRIKLLGVVTNDEAVATTTGTPTDNSHGVNDDVYTAITNMQTVADAYFATHSPFRAIIGGTSYNNDAGTLTNVSTGAVCNSTAILIGDTVTGNGACVGLMLGRLSVIPTMRKVSRVRTGPMKNTTAWVGSAAVGASGGEIAAIARRGYITWCTYPNVSGFFFSGDDTCSSTTDDYHFLSRGRVIDKAHILAYTTFVQEVDDEVPVNADGTLDAGFCKWLSQQIVNQVNNAMTINKEISSVSCFIDPAQNILSTNKLRVILRIVPVGYATDIEISLGFTNPAL